MAELKVTVKIEGKDSLQTLKKDVQEIQKIAKDIKINFKDANTALKAVQDIEKAQKKLEEMAEKRLNLEKQYQTQLAKTATAAARITAEEEKSAREKEKTRQVELRLQQATEKRLASEATANAKIVDGQRKLQQEIVKTERQSSKLGETWKNMFSAFSLSNIATNSINRVIMTMRQAIKEALSEMKELDTALSHYRQVTGADQSIASEIGNKAYSVGSKYGTSAADYAESVATYARAGYKETASDLAELSLKTVIVGQTTQEIADQFLLTMDAAYGYNGSVKELTKTLDFASEIDSSYATTIEKIAAGLGLVAPLANQVHVSEKELTAAIGTITAVTQRSGAESARALRSLFLNILKDTTTEIEDGVTATEESISDIQVLLNKYAKSAVDAAQATGAVVNPMEAIGALAQSMKDGLLTESQLMEMLSSIGGKLRVSQLVALVSHWDMYTEMLQKYEGSVGSADKKVEAYLDSWDAKVKILKNTWTEFVASSLKTEWIKGIITGVTNLLAGLGNLSNALKSIAAIVASIKLAQKAAELGRAATAAQDMAQASARLAAQFRWQSESMKMAGDAEGSFAMKTASVRMEEQALEQQAQATTLAHQQMATAIAAIAVMAIMTANNIYNAIYEKQMANLKEAREEAENTALVAQENASKVSEAYETFYSAKKYYDEGKISTETYEAAVRNLTDALGEEASAIDDVNTSLGSLSLQQLIKARDETESVIRAARAEAKAELNKKNRFNFQGLNPIQDAYLSTDSNGVLLAENVRFKKAIDAYKEYADIRDKYLAGDRSVSEADYSKATKALGQVSDAFATIIAQEEVLTETNAKIAELEFGVPDVESLTEVEAAIAGTGEAGETAAEGLEEAEKAFIRLSGAADEAKAALKEYEEATKTEKDDDWKSYADAWKAAFEDIQNGFKGSNAVNAALDLFFTPEQLMRMRERGIEAADVIADDFWKSIFTYTDENGNLQFINEDAGSQLAYKLYDDFAKENGGKIIDKNGEIVASFEEVDGELKVNIDNYENLAQAMSDMYDHSIDPEVLMAMMEGLGKYSNEVQESAEGIEKMAQGMNALTESGAIDLDKFVQGMIDLHVPTDEILAYIEKIDELRQKGDIEAKYTLDAETGLKTYEELIKNRDDLNKKDADAKVKADTAEAEAKLDKILFKEKQIEQNSPTVTITAEDMVSAKLDEINRKQMQEKVVKIRYEVHDSKVAERLASGTKHASGGLTLVNENGAEIIKEDGIARIAGNGKPTLTWLQSGAEVYNATETRAILGSSDESNLYDGINAYDTGTARRYDPNKGKTTTKDDTSSNTSDTSNTQGTTTTQPKDKGKTDTTSDKDEELEKLKKVVELRKSELSLLEAQGKSTKKKIQKEREIYDALGKQIAYMKEHKYSQTEINKLLTEQYKIQEEINKLNKELYDDLSKAVQARIDKNNKARDKEKKEIQDQIDAKKKEHDLNKENLELEEKELAVQEAKDKLAKAKAQRTVRYYNAKTGQWEWKANAQDVESARKEYTEAKQNLSDYKSEKAYEAEIAKLERKQEKIDSKYDKRNEKLQSILDALEEPVISISKALKNIEKNATKDQKSTIDELNKIIVPILGKKYKISTKNLYDSGGVLKGVGGIKGTEEDEVVLPPDITKSMLKPISTAVLSSRMNELRYLYGTTGGMAGITNSNSIGTQYNGNQYTFGNITLTEGQARSTTIYDLVQKSRGLRAYNAM